MAFCTTCGKSISGSDQFCANCGAKQAGSQNNALFDCWHGLSPKNAILLCYIPWFGWIVALTVLVTQRFRNDYRVRFHAFQSLYLFGVWLAIDWIASPVLRFPLGHGGWYPSISNGIFGLLHLAVFLVWIVMLAKAAREEDFRLPIIGDFADRSAHSQRV